jgi:hypothetical protein
MALGRPRPMMRNFLETCLDLARVGSFGSGIAKVSISQTEVCVDGQNRKYWPGCSPAICCMRSRALDNPSTASIHIALFGVPAKMSKLSFMDTPPSLCEFKCDLIFLSMVRPHCTRCAEPNLSGKRHSVEIVRASAYVPAGARRRAERPIKSIPEAQIIACANGDGSAGAGSSPPLPIRPMLGLGSPDRTRGQKNVTPSQILCLVLSFGLAVFGPLLTTNFRVRTCSISQLRSGHRSCARPCT